MGINGETKKPHAVCLPYPAQGHITPMLQLAKLLHYKGFHITFVNNEYNHMRFLKSRGPHSLDGLPDFRFAAIADGLPPTDTCDATQDAKALCHSIRDRLLLAPFKKLLQKLNAEDSNVPPVTCVVSDILSITLSATEELGIPNVLLWTASACSLMGSLHYPQLMERGYIPLKDI
ncbi:hypothetical protein RJ641_013297 [Dillenia turbinata]|uniref:Uncharacterized protein n=1 Tax=Dillenia turbinata TaxID=194707 RepID=A0AAN8ZSY7_9MAGN